MGGGPSINGGMTKEEYQKMLEENRRYEEEATLKRDAAVAMAESQRKRDEAALLDQTKLAELIKIDEIKGAESALSSEINASTAAKVNDSSTLGNTFYNSLFSNNDLYASKQARPK